MVKSDKIPASNQSGQVMISMLIKFLPASVFLVLLAYSPVAEAYLDPSTGSMIVSALVGIFASIALAVKTYWYKLKNLFRRSGKTGSSNDATGDS
jgi:hypothetical protein